MSGIPRGIVSSFCRSHEAFLIPVNQYSGSSAAHS